MTQNTGKLRLIQATFRNFMSYGNNDTTVCFDAQNAVMIVGEDLDHTADGKVSNGTGKTTIMNAVVYGLYDRVSQDDVKKDDLVNNVNKRDMMVSVEFINRTGDHFIVTRCRKAKAGAAGNSVKLEKNGIDISRDSDGTNQLVVDAVGMPFELFIRIVVIPATRTPFLDLPTRATNGASQTAVLEELFNITALSERSKKLKLNISLTESEIKAEQQRIGHIESAKTAHEAQIQNVAKRLDQWDVATATKIVNFSKQLSLIEKVDVDQQYALSQQAVSIESKISQLSVCKTAKLNSLRQLTQQYKQFTHELKELRNHQCPYCDQPYQDSLSRVSDVEKSLEDVSQQLVAVDDEIAEIETELTARIQELNEVKQQITTPNIEELMKVKQEQSELHFQLQTLKDSSNPYVEVLKELEHGRSQFVVDMSKINQLKHILDHQNFLLKLLTKNNSFLRKALLDQNIPYLNERLAHYISLLGLKYKVVFHADLTAEISILGRTIGFGNLSAGQKARVNLAISFAFRSVSQRFGCPVNVCMLDETLDVGLDAVGVNAAARMLKQEARDSGTSLFIISHREELFFLFDNHINVRFQGGFSRIVDNKVDPG